MKITRFEDLDCWQEATSLAINIYRITSEGDIATDFGLRDQIRRSAVSIASNIAEGK
jgi:four helix bundle protein